MKSFVFCLSVLAFVTVIPVRETYGQESVPDFSVGARNASLANSNISESSDVSVMYENPAAIAYLENRSIFVNHAQVKGSFSMQENLAVPVIMSSPIVIALGLDAFHSGLLGPTVPTKPRIFEYGYDVALAYQVTPTLSLGGSSALRHGVSTDGSQAWGSYFAFGADYAPTPNLSYSIVWGGLGRDVTYFPQINGIGMTAASVPTQTFLEVGATMSYPTSASLRPPIFILSLSSEKILDVSGHFYKGGLEIRPFNFLELRIGYMAGPGVASARYGVGVVEGLFRFQYAIYPAMGTKNMLQQFSLSMEL